jgi:hypothetical protein
MICRELLAHAKAGGELPLDYMLKVMRSKSKSVDDTRRDDMAKAAAPFIHARLSSVENKTAPLDLSKLTDPELEFLIGLVAKLTEAEAASRSNVGDLDSTDHKTRH